MRPPPPSKPASNQVSSSSRGPELVVYCDVRQESREMLRLFNPISAALGGFLGIWLSKTTWDRVLSVPAPRVHESGQRDARVSVIRR